MIGTLIRTGIRVGMLALAVKLGRKVMGTAPPGRPSPPAPR